MLKLFLYPFSAIYGIVVYFRNLFYDFKIFKSVEFDQPIISIGNITVGGTGKTPFTEYIAELLKKEFNVATLSRGYKRKTSGFRIVDTNSKSFEVGDESIQIKCKFPEITVAVCENRVTGVNKLLESAGENPLDVVILDDAFQHRRIKPGINILLVDYNRPLKDDVLLPAGRLREGAIQIRRAGIIIVTKCPEEITPIARRIMQKNVYLRPYQSIYFSTIEYGKLKPVFPSEKFNPDKFEKNDYGILLVTGIASSKGIYEQLQKKSSEIVEIEFNDHKQFTEKDIELIMNKFNSFEVKNKIIVTTEKDVMRFKDIKDLDPVFKSNLYCLPMKVKFLDKEGALFDQKIINYVGENKSNLSLHKRKGKN